ncbi:MAG: response regulator [Gammaproteobacteria bacterium]|nr:response regulator [Gammaproteobacteria bacterium]
MNTPKAPGRILVAEDEVRLATVLRDYLLAAAYDVTLEHRGDTALASIEADPPDLLLLDLMLPGLDGMELCRRIRSAPDPRVQEIIVIMITARVDEVDRLLGLEVGADDYVCKPFSPREVVARVRAQLRRVRRLQAGPVTQGVVVDVDAMRARAGAVDIDLTPVELRILARLLENPGRVWSRQQLMDAAYTDHRVVNDRTIDTHMKNLRRKLTEALGAEAPISSVYGVGYRYEG